MKTFTVFHQKREIFMKFHGFSRRFHDPIPTAQPLPQNRMKFSQKKEDRPGDPSSKVIKQSITRL
jgi:hypothetical protein